MIEFETIEGIRLLAAIWSEPDTAKKNELRQQLHKLIEDFNIKHKQE